MSSPFAPAAFLRRLLAYQLALSVFGLGYWVQATFGDVSVDQAIWHLVYAQGTAHLVTNIFYVELLMDLLVAPLLGALLAAAVHSWLAERVAGWRRRLLAGAPALCGIAALGALGLQFSAFSYAAAYFQPDRFAQDFVDPATVPLLQERRRNLVLIYAESLEASYGNEDLFGRDLLEPLHVLGGQSYPFYRPAAGATWTMAAMVATQCGVPLKVYAQQDMRDRGHGKSFLPGATCLGDVLQAHGYRNVFLGGVSLSFAGKGRFLRDHGYQQASGLDEWRAAGARKDEANVWGLWDSALFERATASLDRLHASGQPFSLTLLTLDTHNPFAFLSPACAREGARDFDGIVACSAGQIAGFLGHAKERGYFADTTFVVIGDHLAMPNPALEQLEASPQRGIFNLVLGDDLPRPNAAEIMPFDWFPTLVELAGIDVAGDRLGLGYSAVGDADAPPDSGRFREWSLAHVNGSKRYDQLWQPAASEPAAQ